MEKELKELNFNSLLILLDKNVQEYDFNKYLANGKKHNIEGFCTSCEEKGLDKNFSLKTVSHGATSQDIILATGQQDIDFSDWKNDGVMFVMENPGGVYNFYDGIKYKGIEKYPTKEWYWVHTKQKRIEFPHGFTYGDYKALFNSIIFTFKLKCAYFTNVVKCGMVDNKNNYIVTSEYNQDCVNNCCETYFKKELEIVNPKVVFCFGRRTESIVRKYFTSYICLPHPARHPNGLRDEYLLTLYFTLILRGLYEVGVYNDDDCIKKSMEFFAYYRNK